MTPRSAPLPLFLVFVLVVLLAFFADDADSLPSGVGGVPSTASASTASASYDAYNYDLTTPRFTPDGRLLQVEYATRSPEGSFPLVAIPVAARAPSSPNDDGEEENEVEGAVVIATLVGGGGGSSSAATATATAGADGSERREDGGESGGSSTASSSAEDGRKTNNSRRGRRRRGQSRLISLPIGPPSYRSAFAESSGSASRLASSPPPPSSPAIVLGLSGVLSDSVSLLRTASVHVSAFGRTYGLHRMHATTTTATASSSSSSYSIAATSSSGRTAVPSAGTSAPDVARRVASALGEECQVRSFGGGIRPYGSSVLICGVEGNECCLCVTDAGGGVSVKRLAFGVADGALRAESAVIVGGSSGTRSGLERALEDRLGRRSSSGAAGGADDAEGGDDDDEATKCNLGPVRRAVEATALALFDCHCRQRGETGAAVGLTSFSTSPTLETDDGDDAMIDDVAARMEIVVAARGGSHHLDDEQIRRILKAGLTTRDRPDKASR